VVIGTARTSPGASVKVAADLDRPECTEGLARVYAGLCDLGVDALITIGGDGTLATAVRLHAYQQRMKPGTPHVRVIHIPKTIDNDYQGIDFAFGFFTAVDVLSRELLNLRADAQTTDSYFIAQTMGRSAGWLAYGVAVAGEAHMVISVEDVVGDLRDPTETTAEGLACLSVSALVDRIVDLMLSRASRGKRYGTVVLAEGLGALLPAAYLKSATTHPDGSLSLTSIDVARLVAQETARRYQERTNERIKVTGVQLGYESRCAAPHAFDVMLGCQLGVGAYRALSQQGLDGCMVSVSGPLNLRYVPFAQLVDPVTLRVPVRYVEPGGDYETLVRLLESRRAPR
jgi:6-phosphofructokinase 1